MHRYGYRLHVSDNRNMRIYFLVAIVSKEKKEDQTNMSKQKKIRQQAGYTMHMREASYLPSNLNLQHTQKKMQNLTNGLH